MLKNIQRLSYLARKKKNLVRDLLFVSIESICFFCVLNGCYQRKTERKFHQYLLHHFVAVSLILFSLMSNQMLAGAMILVVHDISDILMAGCRAYQQTTYQTKYVSGICYLVLLLVWIFCRILVFPFCLQQTFTLMLSYLQTNGIQYHFNTDIYYQWHSSFT